MQTLPNVDESHVACMSKRFFFFLLIFTKKVLCVACTICCWKCSKFVNWNSVWFAFFLWVVDWSKRHFLFRVVKKWHVCESESDVSWKIAFQDDSFQSHAFLFCLQHTFVRYTQPYSSSTVELIITFGNLSSFASVSHTPTMFCCKGKVATPHYVHWPNPNKRWFLEGEFFAFWKRTYSRRPKTQEETMHMFTLSRDQF